jgi:hypothetical protein
MPEQAPQISWAAQLLRSKQPSEAFNVLLPYLRDNPGSVDAWYLLHFATESRDDKAQALRRVLALDPDHAQAKQRLAKLEGRSLPTSSAVASPAKLVGPTTLDELEVQKPPRDWRSLISNPAFWVVLALASLLLGALCAVLFNLVSPPAAFSPDFSGLAAETRAPVAATGIAAADPDLVSSATPSLVPPTSTPSATIAPSDTTTPTSTFALPGPDVAAQMDLIELQVAELRNLDVLGPTDRYVIAPDAVRQTLENEFLARTTAEQLANEVLVLSALGLVEPTYDMYAKVLNSIGEGIGGFYVPWEARLFVIGQGFTGDERWVYSHEYGHALVDQHFQLADLGVYPECLHQYDRCIAIRAVVEGDASLVMNLWLEQHATAQDIEDLLSFDPPTEIINTADFAPPYAIREWSFLYQDGLRFVIELFERGGWDAVNRAYIDLPTSTEQILHPEKYESAEQPIRLEDPDVNQALGEDWQLIEADSLGELGTLMVLTYGSDFAAEIPLAQAEEAAAGWGGDWYQMLYNSRRDARVLVVHWTWDSQTDADEFQQSLEQHLHLLYRGLRIEGTDSCWTRQNDHVSCVFASGQDTLWLRAPDLETLNVIRALFQGQGFN